MLFKGIGRTFSTENDCQFETIGAFWDELAAKYGRANLQGLGFGWTEQSIEYVIGLIDGEIDGANRAVELPDTGWIAVMGKTADLGEIYERIYQEGRLKYEIERFTDSGDCEIMYYRSTVPDKCGGMKGMFTANMIAPCGLDCSICKRALAVTGPCAGCRGPNDNKPEFCSSGCGIILCEKRKANGYSFCDECPDFPCTDVMEKETRYGSKYPLRESPLENLRTIQEAGMAAFLERERRQWTCSACGSVICVHTGVCSGCGRQYADSMNR